MELSQNIAELYNRLKTVLKTLFETQISGIELIQSEKYPLLILETASDSIGFAILEDKPISSFDAAYNSLKIIYRKRHNIWKDRNLSFVICRTSIEQTHDAFFSSIETDVYFCRKYVFYLHEGHDDLVREFLRLPFMPLTEDFVSGMMRPPSAQSLLQNLNISAQIARRVIVPQEYSAKRIVDQLLTQKEPLSSINTDIDFELRSQSKPTENTRIKRIEIEAFRAYKKRQEFNLDADVVVFYGPNGLGKTSLFDAIDYVCTGRIGRLCQRRISQKDFIGLAKHLGALENDGHVTMDILQEDSLHSVKRKVNDWGSALIDANVHSRASALQFLTSYKGESKKIRIENIERLFRATHLFGQSDSELLTDFTKDSTLSPDLVHRMLALDDYASGLAKASAVMTQLDKKLGETRNQIDSIDAQVNRVKNMIDAIPSSKGAIGIGKQLKDTTTSLISNFQKFTGVKIYDIDPTHSNVREWRAMAESSCKDAQERLDKIKEIESEFSRFNDNKSALNSTIEEIAKFENMLEQNDLKQKKQKEIIRSQSDNLKFEQEASSKSILKLNLLSDLNISQKIFQKTKSSLNKWQLDLKQVTEKSEKATSELHQLFPLVEDRRNTIAKFQYLIQEKKQIIFQIESIQNDYQSWEKNCVSIAKIEQDINRIQSIIAKEINILDKASAEIEHKEKKIMLLENEYDSYSKHQLGLTELLDKMEQYVISGVCPTCGIDHNSKDFLINKIHEQKQSRPQNVEILSEKCGAIRKEIKQDKALLKNRNDEFSFKQNELKTKREKHSNLQKAVESFRNSLASVDFPEDKQLSIVIARRLDQEKKALQSSLKAILKDEADLKDMMKIIKDLEEKQAQYLEAQVRANKTILPLEKQIKELHKKFSGQDISLEMSLDELNTQIKIATDNKLKVGKLVGEITSKIEIQKKAIAETENQNREIRLEIKQLYQSKDALENRLQSFGKKTFSIFNHDKPSIEIINKIKKESKEDIDQLFEIRKRFINLERTIDASQRSAQLAELETENQSLKKQKHLLIEATERMVNVKKWFSKVRDVLQTQSSNFVSKHIEAFGPLSTLIQRRLRAVYGFGDVSLFAKGNEIHVEVGWERQHVKPTDYFSDSQKQILMLSLFLSGRLTQTWSGFAPILMDDPVTHFDDLNAFGFVELIRGLAITSPGKRQFFISTCEDRLFELMVKKFKSLEGGAKFYRFEGIGHDGPIVVQHQ